MVDRWDGDSLDSANLFGTSIKKPTQNVTTHILHTLTTTNTDISLKCLSGIKQMITHLNMLSEGGQ